MGNILESPLPLETISLGFSLSYEDKSGIGGYYITTSIAGTIVYSRIRPKSNRRWCGGAISMDAVAKDLLNPGEFFLNGSCCCTFGASLYYKAAPRISAGIQTYSLRDGDDPDTTPPPPPPVPLYMRATFLADFPDCRKNMHAYDAADRAAVNPDIFVQMAVPGIANTRSAEQVITLHGDGTYAHGSADLQWVDPFGETHNFTIGFPDPTATAPNLSQIQFTHDLGSDLQVTNEATGFRLGFIGKYAKRSVNFVSVVDNSIVFTFLQRRPLRFSADIGIEFEDGTAWFGQTIEGTETGHCAAAFGKTVEVIYGDDRPHGTASIIGG